MTVASLVFWASVAALVYVYAGFPLLVAGAGQWRRRRVRAAEITPSVSLVIAAYNEASVIAERLDNALALDYPADRLQIIVAADGCTDDTARIVAGYATRGVHLLNLPRRGKIRALDAAVADATGEIVVFSDANTMCHRDAVRRLVANFADEEVGGVAGHTGYRIEPGSESSSRGEDLYWNYDAWLKQRESWTGSVVSAHGGLYGIRRRLYRPVDDGAVTDDFAISTGVIEQGYRLVFEPRALAAEYAIPEAPREFRRRVRLMTRGLRAVLLRRRLLNPFRHGFYALVLFSHKVLRRMAPVFLVTLAAATMALAPAAPAYRLAAVGQAAFYALAVAGLLLRRAPIGEHKLLYIPFYYCMANAASLVALAQLLRGTRIEVWQPQRQGR